MKKKEDLKPCKRRLNISTILAILLRPTTFLSGKYPTETFLLIMIDIKTVKNNNL